MDRDRIKEIIEKIYPRNERYHGVLSLYSVAIVCEHIAKIARAEALEEAAKVCDSSGKEPSSLWMEEGCWKHASYYCAEQIRALKGKS